MFILQYFLKKREKINRKQKKMPGLLKETPVKTVKTVKFHENGVDELAEWAEYLLRLSQGQSSSRPPEYRATLQSANTAPTSDIPNHAQSNSAAGKRAPLATLDKDHHSTTVAQRNTSKSPANVSENRGSPLNGPLSSILAKNQQVVNQPNRQSPASNGSYGVTSMRFADDNDDLGVMSEVETEATGPSNSLFTRAGLRSTIAAPGAGSQSAANRSKIAARKTFGLVFIQFEDETKRVVLPDEPDSLQDVRALFLRSFPDVLTKEYMQQPHVRIYIQDPTKPDFFYELDDVRDVKDRSVLRLREHNAKTPTPMDQPQTIAMGPGAFEPITPQPPPHLMQHQAPPPSYLDEEMQYYSESELDIADYRSRRVPYYPSHQQQPHAQARGRFPRGAAAAGAYYPNRPASAVPPGANTSSLLSRRYGAFRGPPGNPPQGDFQHQPRSSFRSPYGAPISGPPSDLAYGSDRDESLGRSGSATPVIDEEARTRMMQMEKQLSNISTLLHQALSAKTATSPSEPPKDLDALRKEILGPSVSSAVVYRNGANPNADTDSDAGSISRFSDMSDKASFVSIQSGTNEKEYYPLPHTEIRRQLHDVKGQVGSLQAELKHLRRTAQMNAQSSKEILRDTLEKVKALLTANMNSTELSPFKSQLEMTQPLTSGAGDDEFHRTRLLVDTEQERHKQSMKGIDRTLVDLERQIEEIRLQVVNTNRKLRVNEVETLTSSLMAVGRMTAHLKNQFPILHSHMKAVMSAEMERVVKEEKFLKEEPSHVDNALRRCKKLTNTMMTMKKLALVQDKNIDKNEGDDRKTPPAVPPPPDHYRPLSAMSLPVRPSHHDNQHSNGNGANGHLINNNRLQNDDRPMSQMSNASSQPHVLDNLLEELQTVAVMPGYDMQSRNTNVNGRPSYPRAFQDNPTNTNGMNRDERETTPSSVSSEPINKPPVPPPPMKYHTLDRKPQMRAPTTNDLEMLKSSLRPPAAMERTNALDEIEVQLHGPASVRPVQAQQPVWAKSASSNESVNSQDGRVSGDGYENGAAPAKPPPPPPPRNRQELMQQRQAEMMDRKLQFAANSNGNGNAFGAYR